MYNACYDACIQIHARVSSCISNSYMASSLFLVAVLIVWSVCVTVWVILLETAASDNDTIKCKETSDSKPQVLTFAVPAIASSPLLKPRSSLRPTASYGVENRLLYYSSQIFYRPDNTNGLEKCTLVLLVWHKEALDLLLSHYCGIHILKRILVVWNSVEATINLEAWAISCRKEVMLIQSNTDKLTNRYLPWKEIETDCKL